MALVQFIDDSAPYLSANNLNNNFNYFKATKIKDTDITVNQGTLAINHSFYTDEIVCLNIRLTGVSLTAETNVEILSLANNILSNNMTFFAQTNTDQNASLLCWGYSTGKINIRSNVSISNKELRIMGIAYRE